MSIERNNSGFTIKRLSDFGSDKPIYEYFTLYKSGFAIDKLFPVNGFCLIRASVNGNTWLLGNLISGQPPKMNGIQIADGTAYWKINDVTIASCPTDNKVHEYGFAGGYAIYDGKKVNAAQTPITSTNRLRVAINGVYNNNAYSFTETAEIRLYRVNIELCESSSDNPILARYYPITNNSAPVANKQFLYDAMDGSNVINVTIGTSGTCTLGSTCIYGIQLEDLRYLTGTAYRDLVAIVTEDGGVDSRSNIDNPLDAYTATKEGVTHSFAFSLHTDAGGSVPFPTGCTFSGAKADSRGELIMGRRPLWDIWNDSVAHGFYIKNDSATDNLPQLRFNIFKNADGSDTPVRLEWFDGYDTTKSHPPRIELSHGIISMEFHNGVAERCDNRAAGRNNDGEVTIWYADDSADFEITAVLGNAVPWNIPYDALVPAGTPDAKKYEIYGGGASLEYNGQCIASAVSRETTPLCSGCDTTIKTKYQTEGVTSTVKWNTLSRGLFKDLKHEQSHQLQASAMLTLARGTDEVTMPHLFGSRQVTISGVFDPTSNGSNINRRQFVKEHGLPNRLAYFITTSDDGPDKYGMFCNPKNISADWEDTGLLRVAVREVNNNLSGINSIRDLWAVVRVIQANPDGVAVNAHVALVQGIRVESLVNQGNANSYPAGKARAAYRSIAIYGNYYCGGTNSISLLHQYLNILAADFNDFGTFGGEITIDELNNANIYFDIYPTAPVLSRFKGSWYDTMLGMAMNHTPYTLNGTNKIPFLALDESYMLGQPGTAVCGFSGRKWVKDGNNYYPTVEGPDGEQAQPSFKETVILKKNGTQVASFAFNTNFGTPVNRRYTDQSISNGNYVCTVGFRERSDTTLNPAGGISNNGGLMWFYDIMISCKAGVATQAGDVFDVSFTN